MRRKRGEETGLIKVIMDYLSYKKVWRYRTNSGGLRDTTGRLVRFGAPGHPDIVARFRPIGGPSSGFSGRVVWIEAKSERGKITPAQEAWRELAATYGDVYILARSLEDVREVFE